jgi:hypothetical protein
MRRLAYKDAPGIAHDESAWIQSRRTLYGENVDMAEAELKKLIESGQIVVIDPPS